MQDHAPRPDAAIADLIDLARYPMDRPGSAEWQVMVDRARAELAAQGMFNLDGFMKADVLQSDLARLLPRFASEAFVHARRHNIYFRKSIPDLPADHPALVEVETKSSTLCGDQLTDTALMVLYEWAPFAQFLSAAMDQPTLYCMEDPLARLNCMAYRDGEGLNWHFDRSEFTTTLLLQAPEAGSVFEYRTNLRSDTDPNYAGVAKLLTGDDPEKQAIRLTPGTLNVFAGKRTAHRVTPAEGSRARVVAVFSFFDRPGVMMTAEEQKGFYGRTV